MTEQDQSRDRPGDEMVRLTVSEAAKVLGITEAGVRKRVQRESGTRGAGRLSGSSLDSDTSGAWWCVTRGKQRTTLSSLKPEGP